MRRDITRHARDRYRSRMKQPAASYDDVLGLVRAGKHQSQPPKGMTRGDWTDSGGYVIAGDAVFVMKADPDHGRLVAVTCLRLHRFPKADQRAWREQSRESWAA